MGLVMLLVLLVRLEVASDNNITLNVLLRNRIKSKVQKILPKKLNKQVLPRISIKFRTRVNGIRTRGDNHYTIGP